MVVDPLRAVERERDLYLGLLQLGHQRDVRPFLQNALRLLVAATGAEHGYIELFDEESEGDTAHWWVAHDLSDERIADVQRSVSRGIIAATLAAGETLFTPSAVLDARFATRSSVVAGAIRAVVCAPIGADPPRGVLYLEAPADDPTLAGTGVRAVELACQHLAPLVDRVVAVERHRTTDDPTAPFRKLLAADALIGRSQAMATMLREVALVAGSPRSVLIRGETGTGKTEVARVIHASSPRARGPFLPLNCSLLQETTAESQLFGHERWAFTGADRRHDGLVTAANGGTLFLDEVGELPLAVQAKLLQFLQSKEYMRMGGTELLRADTRIIAATNVDLEAAVADGRFRRDLLHRLEVFFIHAPSLAERREDIVEIAEAFCAEACRTEGLAARRLSPDALRALETADWSSGNLRELQNAIVRAVCCAHFDGAEQIERRHLFPATAGTTAAGADAPPSYQEATRAFQKRLVREALEACDWHVVSAAQRLDLSKARMYEIIRTLDIRRD